MSSAGISPDALVFTTECSSCGHDVRLPLPVTTETVADKTDGRWVTCAACGHTNYATRDNGATGGSDD